MNCYQAKAGELAKHWYVIDADGMVVGRLAAQIAPILMGKHRPTYTPHIDTGDFVIVTNVEKVVFTGEKWRQKSYQRYSGLPGRPEGRGGLEAVPAPARADLRAGRPADDAEEQDRPAHARQAEAVRRAEHPHQAQQPIPLEPLSGRPTPAGAVYRARADPEGEGDRGTAAGDPRGPPAAEAPPRPRSEPARAGPGGSAARAGPEPGRDRAELPPPRARPSLGVLVNRGRVRRGCPRGASSDRANPTILDPRRSR